MGGPSRSYPVKPNCVQFSGDNPIQRQVSETQDQREHFELQTVNQKLSLSRCLAPVLHVQRRGQVELDLSSGLDHSRVTCLRRRVGCAAGKLVDRRADSGSVCV